MPRSTDGKSGRARPSPSQLAYLMRGLDQPGGKLPLFDEEGQRIDARTVRACIARGWAEPWTANPVKPDWLICRLTEEGRRIAMAAVGRDRHGRTAARRRQAADSQGQPAPHS